MRSRLAVIALAVVVLASCSGGKKDSSTTLPLLLQTTTSTAAPATPVVVRILSPEKGSVQGRSGRGMVVALVVTAKDPAALPAEFRLGGALLSPAAAVRPGHNAAFPGLVVGLSTTGPALGGAAANLANLFQIVSPAPQPDGSVQVSAVWTNAQADFGADTEATLVAFVVAGTAPDAIPASPADVNLSSNAAQVTFRLAAVDPADATSTTTIASGSSTTTAKPTTTTTKPSTVAATSTTRPATTTTAVPATTTTTKFLGLF